MSSVMVNTKLKSKIEDIGEILGALTLKMKDISDCFWFNNEIELQEFLHTQARERFFDKALRKGYFDYINDANETYRYYVKSNRGSLEILSEVNLGVVVN